MKAGRLSLNTLTHQKAPKKKKPRAASDTRASINLCASVYAGWGRMRFN